MKFLIIRLSSLGDVIHSLPLVNALRKNFPDAQVDWLTGKKGYEVLSLISEINKVYLASLQSLQSIQKQNYDYVIDVQGLFKSAFLAKLASGKKIIGFKNTREFADIFYDEKINVGSLFDTKNHIVDLNLKLISNLLKNNNEKVKFLIPKIQSPDKNELIENTKLKKIAVFPATTWKSKLWPMGYWYELIKKLSEKFYVYVCAAGSDLNCTGELIKNLDLNNIPYKNLVGKTNIKDLIYLVQNVDLVIGLDSAALHLAGALKNDYGKPDVIGIYGPTSVYRNGPYNLTADALSLTELDCISCRKKLCPLGHHMCMNNLLPEYVIERIYSKSENRVLC